MNVSTNHFGSPPFFLATRPSTTIDGHILSLLEGLRGQADRIVKADKKTKARINIE